MLEAKRQECGFDNITTNQADLDADEFPPVRADRAWCRWVFAFVRRPREILTRIASAIAPQGVIVIHEYFDYATWRSVPRCPELEDFVIAVMASWRGTGGEPDVGLSLPRWLEELGFELRSVRAIIDAVRPGEIKWEWLKSFINVGRERLVDLGYLGSGHSSKVWEAFTRLEKNGARMITPGVLEIVAAHTASSVSGLKVHTQ